MQKDIKELGSKAVERDPKSGHISMESMIQVFYVIEKHAKRICSLEKVRLL
jgi:hypothetical protein